MSSLYEDFLRTKGNWRNSLVYKSIKSSSRSGRRGIRKWLTQSQLEQIFGDKAVVKAIIARKMADKDLRATEVREHPDAPGLLLNVSL